MLGTPEPHPRCTCTSILTELAQADKNGKNTGTARLTGRTMGIATLTMSLFGLCAGRRLARGFV